MGGSVCVAKFESGRAITALSRGLSLLSLVALPVGAFGEDGDVRSRFRAAYGPHAPALQAHYCNVVATTTIVFAGGKNTQFRKQEVKCSLRNWLLATEDVIKETETGKVIKRFGEEAGGSNSRYAFSLARKDDKQYVVTDLKLHEAGDHPEMCWLSCPIADYRKGQTYLEMAESPEHRILSFEDCDWQERKNMKVLRMEYERHRIGGQKALTSKAEYYFSPADGWICCGSREWDDNSSKTYESIYTYSPKIGEDYPRLERIEDWIRDQKEPAKSRRTRVAEITEFNHVDPIPDANFRLSAFGIPEPEGVEWPKPSKTWLWLLTGGIALGALAVLFGWFSRHRARRAIARPVPPLQV
jgi:hypothetical protein